LNRDAENAAFTSLGFLSARVNFFCLVAGHRMFVFSNSDGVILSVATAQGKMREYFFYSLVKRYSLLSFPFGAPLPQSKQGL
jgi:hypothetical protein